MIFKKIIFKLRTAGSYLNLRKTIYKKYTANISLNVERLNGFHLKIKNKERISAVSTFYQHSTGRSSNCIGKQIGMEVIKLPLFTDGMIWLCRKFHRICKIKLLKLMSSANS